jgi:hypothetical protein
MTDAAGTSGFPDAALANSPGWYGQASASFIDITTTSLATPAARPGTDGSPQDCVAFSDTALQILATSSNGGTSMSLELQQTSMIATAGSSAQDFTSFTLSLDIQSSQEPGTSSGAASLQGISILVDGQNTSQLFGGVMPAGSIGAADQQIFVTEALAAANEDANAGGFSIDVCYSSIDVAVSRTNDDLQIGIDAQGRLSDLGGMPGQNNPAVLANMLSASAGSGSAQTVATNPASQPEDANATAASALLTTFAKARQAARQATTGLGTKRAAVNVIA